MKAWQGVLLLVIGLVIGVVSIQVFQPLSEEKGRNGDNLEEVLGSEGLPPRESAWEEVGPAIGLNAPDFTLIALDGESYQLSDLKGEKPVLINFWASWCPPCKAEAPDLVRLYQKYQDEMEIYAVNLTASDTVGDAEKFAEEYGYTFPVLLDKTGEVGLQYQAFSIPTSYFIDRNGKIQNKMIGITTPDQLEKMFQDLIRS